jgi:hypothetical protein
MEITEAIRKIVNQDKPNPALGIICKVTSVDSPTCVCSPVDGSADIEDVRLKAGDGDGVLFIPVIGSVVIVQLINDVEGYVSMFSDVDSIQLLDGSFGGLTKTQELKTQLDKTNEVVQIIHNVLTTWSPVSNDGGAALKAAAIAALTGKTEGDFSNIESDKITHGQ